MRPLYLHHTPLAGYGWILQALILALIVLVVWWLLRSGKTPYSPKDTPLDILKKRYARGEITKKEFNTLKKDLGE